MLTMLLRVNLKGFLTEITIQDFPLKVNSFIYTLKDEDERIKNLKK
jgi:hypothetical protein